MPMTISISQSMQLRISPMGNLRFTFRSILHRTFSTSLRTLICIRLIRARLLPPEEGPGGGFQKVLIRSLERVSSTCNTDVRLCIHTLACKTLTGSVFRCFIQLSLSHGSMWDREPEPEPCDEELLDLLTEDGDREKHQRRLVFDQQLLDDEPINALRTPSARKKYQGRQGARQVRLIEQQEAGTLAPPEGATSFRALAARANYLSQDRPDIAFAAKELCRETAYPTQASIERLKRLIRYLAKVPRLVIHFY